MRNVRSHLVIPDTQVKPGVDITHLRWIGQFIVDKKPDVIVHLGDHWDMPSLSSYDRGKKQMEGRRYKADVIAGNYAMEVLDGPLNEYNDRQKAAKHAQYTPEKHLLRGNHEDRIVRATECDAALDGTIGLHDLESPGWQVHDFLRRVKIDGVFYAHYFYNPNSGRPMGGMVSTRLKTLGYSFTMGHQQVYDIAVRDVPGGKQRGLVAGACYLHEEEYKGPQGNDHWRGIIWKHQVKNGNYSITEVDLDYLCWKYEGVELDEWKEIEDNPNAVYAPDSSTPVHA